ncbi:MAG: hypothetical protein AB8H47_31190 [Bacteroidia bacterium]
MNMFQTNTNSLPMIVADEKEALLTSVISLLRQKGFEVIIQEQSPINAQINDTNEKLDALSILRMVSENWPQNTPVSIFNVQSKMAQSTLVKPKASYTPALLQYA